MKHFLYSCTYRFNIKVYDSVYSSNLFKNIFFERKTACITQFFCIAYMQRLKEMYSYMPYHSRHCQKHTLQTAQSMLPFPSPINKHALSHKSWTCKKKWIQPSHSLLNSPNHLFTEILFPFSPWMQRDDKLIFPHQINVEYNISYHHG